LVNAGKTRSAVRVQTTFWLQLRYWALAVFMRVPFQPWWTSAKRPVVQDKADGVWSAVSGVEARVHAVLVDACQVEWTVVVRLAANCFTSDKRVTFQASSTPALCPVV
jgi:hypothetical protein